MDVKMPLWLCSRNLNHLKRRHEYGTDAPCMDDLDRELLQDTWVDAELAWMDIAGEQCFPMEDRCNHKVVGVMVVQFEGAYQGALSSFTRQQRAMVNKYGGNLEYMRFFLWLKLVYSTPLLMFRRHSSGSRDPRILSSMCPRACEMLC